MPPLDSFKVGKEILEAEVKWGITGCYLFQNEDGSLCYNEATMLWCDDGSDGNRGVPCCFGCADEYLDLLNVPADRREGMRLRTW